MSGYTKLWSSILESTIWNEDHPTVRVWITMLAMKDQNGFVAASVPGLAVRARVTTEECRAALGKLLSPDEDSRTKDFEGRRIAEADGGWVVINHEKYRSKEAEEERKEYRKNWMRKKREQARTAVNTSEQVLTDVNSGERKQKQKQKQNAEAEASEKSLPRSASADAPSSPTRILTDAFNESYERRFGAKYAFVGAKDGKIVQDVLKLAGGDAQAVLARLKFAESDAFHRDKLRDWAYFLGAWNKLVPAHAPTVGKANGKPWDERRALERLRSDDPRIVRLGADELRAHGIDPDSYRPAVTL